MSKVNTLFKKYYRILNEQEPAIPEAPAPPADATMAPGPEALAPAAPEISQLAPNEKLVIKILVNSFIFNKTKFTGIKRQIIDEGIDEIKRSVNIPIPQIIDKIVRILCNDVNLCINIGEFNINKESTTLQLLHKYSLLLEQPADATEPQPGDVGASKDSEPEAGNNIIKLKLSEVFAEYQELIVEALNFVPAPADIIMLRTVVSNFGETDPEKISSTVQKLLAHKEEDVDKLKGEGEENAGDEDDTLIGVLSNA